jgi:hypothetical protein
MAVSFNAGNNQDQIPVAHEFPAYCDCHEHAQNRCPAGRSPVQAAFSAADAGEVRILAADFQGSGANQWSVRVTLRHGDTGWDHYADNWGLVDGEGNILGDRVLSTPMLKSSLSRVARAV